MAEPKAGQEREFVDSAAADVPSARFVWPALP
jgi:hypothetical protein